MASLYTLEKGEGIEFDRRLNDAGFTAEDIRKLNKHPEVLAVMAEAMRAHPAFRLIHGRFNPLADKIEVVKRWPGIAGRFSDADFTRAMKEAEARIARFERESPERPLINVVVSVYLDTPHATFAYARDRMRDAFGDKFRQWSDAYHSNIDEKRIALIDDVMDHRNCVRIEVIDLGANWRPKEGMIPKDTRGKNSAHAGVLYAAAQDPEWVRQMNPSQGVPFALAGGYKLNVPDYDPWMDAPRVDFCRDAGKAGLYAFRCDCPDCKAALPLLWE